MKWLLITVIFLSACQGNSGNGDTEDITLREKPMDSTVAVPEVRDTVAAQLDSTAKVYSNERFRNVTVSDLGQHQFLVKGEARVFEATLSWVIEDGHNQLKKGYVTADKGAPEWGNFSIEVDVEKPRQNSVLHLILFEASAKDGSPQSELPVLLY